MEQERLEITSRNWRYQGIFHARMGMMKDRNSKNLTEAEVEPENRWGNSDREVGLEGCGGWC